MVETIISRKPAGAGGLCVTMPKTDMTPQEWKEAWAVVQRASELTGDDRENYLRQTLANNPAVREEVLRLFAENPEDGGDGSGVEQTPSTVGPYRLLKTIGEGGMGTVFLAEQERPLRRKVALKLIRRGLHTPEVLARFEIERQALAILDHPNIAHVYDAGTTVPDGRPYFVMEFVNGIPINRYCAERESPVRERLKLIQQVCEAIQHAHSKAIIHRDVKPANVLVAEQDGKPVPKVIDFGVARAVGTTNAGQTLATGFGSVVGTLQYMSPEQATLVTDVDARTDIYAVGVLLYELLTGTTPLDWGTAATTSLPAALQQIAEVEPLPPSRRWQQSPALHRLSHTLQSELDWIVMKALEKDRNRRYQTANALARDIQRYLDGEPVEAGPPSRSYRLAKLARRYRAWLVTAAIFGLVLLAATVISVREAVRAMRAEQTARAIADFLQNDLLAQASPNVQAGPAKPPDPNLTVRAALDRSGALLAGKFQNQPAIRAAIEHTIADAYLDLGLFPQAREHALQAVELRRKALGPYHPETMLSMDRLAVAYRSEAKYPEAEKIWTELYHYQQKALGESDPGTLQSMHSLAALYRSEGKYKDSAALYERVLPLRRRILGPENPDTMRTANNLGYTYLFVDKNKEAEALLEETLKQRRKVLGAEHPDTLISMSNLALAYEHLGRLEEAQKLLVETLATQQRLLGPEHDSSLGTRLGMGRVLRAMHKLPEAEKIYTEGLEYARRAGVEDKPTSLTMMNNLGNVYIDGGDFARAEQILSRSLALRRKSVGDDHPETLRTLLNLGTAYRKQRKYRQAEEAIRQVVEARRRLSGPDDPNTRIAMTRLAELYQEMGKPAPH
jgi:non-specific serine/threonine protein kinase/serine/threonine-protein kinase